MPIIEVKLWAGPDEETVRRIIQRQTEAICESLGCPPEAVTVIVHQIPKNHFGVAGKQRSPEYDERP